VVQVPASALDDIRVLDLTREAGVYCTKLLADLGADVIRIEPPGGGELRQRPPFVRDLPALESSLLHIYFNTSKRGITLDITTADGQALLKRLAEKADIVIEDWPVGYLDSLGIGYEALARVRPDIIFTSITGFGQTGPHAHYQWSDLVAVAMSGIMTLAGFPDRPPYRPYAPQAYYGGSIQACVGTLLALTHRDLTGEGQRIDLSLQEALSMAQETAMQTWDFQKVVRKRTGGGPRLGITGLSECADGYVYAMVGTGSGAGGSMADVVRWMDSEGKAGTLMEDGTYAVLEEAARVPRGAAGFSMERMAALREQLTKVAEVSREFFLSHTKQELYEGGQAFGLLIGPANDPKDLVESPQLNAREWFVDLPHPELGLDIKMPGLPYRLAKSPARLRRRAPLLGEHNLEVYEGELGLTREQLSGLRAVGVI
jgi:crotonobetainyl-CoA:carnitine CoA-transferase CaiB-like acyl-CoA transferase